MNIAPAREVKEAEINLILKKTMNDKVAEKLNEILFYLGLWISEINPDLPKDWVKWNEFCNKLDDLSEAIKGK